MILPRLFTPLAAAFCILFVLGHAPQGRAEPLTDAPRFSVIRVSADDTLNMRSTPDPGAARVGAIEPDAHGIKATGRTAKRGEYVWREVIYRGVTGWVNGHFLLRERGAPQTPVQADGGSRAGLEPLSCSGTEPFWGLLLKGHQTVLDSLSKGPVGLTLSPARRSPQMTTAWAIDARTKKTDRPVSIIVRRTDQCSDGMSDIVFPYETFITIHGGPFYAGCCSLASQSSGDN